MQHGIILTAGDPRTAADLAAAAEAAGWDGVFTYDAIAIGDDDLYDPWITLAAMAMRTERIRLGAVVFAPSRRRPWTLAKEAITLDVLSGGRLVLPVGLGALEDSGFGNVGEPVDARTRAALLDETLAIMDGLGSGEPFAFEGTHYRFGPMALHPRPVQRPRIPVWVVGAWPHERSLRRAARWDGIVVQAGGAGGAAATTLDILPDVVAWISRERAAAGATGPFDVVVDGSTPIDDPDEARRMVASHEAAGATWWLEADWSDRSTASLRRRIESGPRK